MTAELPYPCALLGGRGEEGGREEVELFQPLLFDEASLIGTGKGGSAVFPFS